MTYTEQFQQFKNLFDLNQDEIVIPDSKIIIRNMVFQSRTAKLDDYTGQQIDNKITENILFRYPVVMPAGVTRAHEAIILLHGLNERSWFKHLGWAKYLCEKTGKAVVMFPLSFHINRGLPEWSDTRKMAALLDIRREKIPGIQEASLANLALSERLTECPERFFMSGLQSTTDLIDLLEQIKQGNHPLFEPNAKTDIFAYSISCLLVQSLMISNPNDILSQSRIVFFAGGSIFSSMYGVSKYIMDSAAFEKIRNFYLDMVRRKEGMKQIQPWLMEHSFGKAFGSLIVPEVCKKERDHAMKNFFRNLMIIALRDDKVMPLEGIHQATGEKFCRSEHLKVVHFPYGYSHENPFPIINKIDEQLEQAFMSVFNPAIEFYLE
jgi:hypothetical protein